MGRPDVVGDLYVGDDPFILMLLRQQTDASLRIAKLEAALRDCREEAVAVVHSKLYVTEGETTSFGNLVHVQRIAAAALEEDG